MEDYQLYSANYQLDGAAKAWYIVPAMYHLSFFKKQIGKYLCAMNLPPILTRFIEVLGLENTDTTCPQFLRHQAFITAEQGLPLNKKSWGEAGYKVFKFVQQKGHMIITWPGAYHCGINTGWNLNEAVNFGLRNWIEEGKKYQPCTCRVDSIDDALTLMVDEIEQKLVE